MIVNSIVGIWPFAFQDNPRAHKLYNLYSKLVFFYFLCFLLCATIELFLLLTAEEIEVGDVVANLSITLLYPFTARKVVSFKGKKVRNLLKKIFMIEDGILGSGDEEVIAIYKIHVRQSRVTNLVYISSVSAQMICYFVRPLLLDDTVKFNRATNETIIVRPLPMSAWLPYDAQQHYFVSYVLHVSVGFIGCCLVMFTDAFSFSMIIFPLGQIRILRHVMVNFPKYVDRVKDQIGCDRDEASFLTMRKCILEHKEIISYVEDYNDCMRNIMLLDFLQSSLQLASIVIELIVTGITAFNVAFYGEYAICMLIRLLVYYWYANEIVVESTNLSTAVYECGWYDEPKKVKQLMKMMILRANQALGLEIGPFTTMTLETFVAIIKATYSFMTIMYK